MDKFESFDKFEKDFDKFNFSDVGKELSKITGKDHMTANDVKTDSASTQPAFTCSKLTIETLEQGVKYVQS